MDFAAARRLTKKTHKALNYADSNTLDMYFMQFLVPKMKHLKTISTVTDTFEKNPDDQNDDREFEMTESERENAGSIIVAAYGGTEEQVKDQRQIYDAVVAELRSVMPCAWTNSTDVMRKFKLKPGTVSVLRAKYMHVKSKLDQPAFKLRALVDTPRLVKRLKEHALPAVGFLTSHNQNKYFKSGKPTVVLFSDMPDTPKGIYEDYGPS